MDTQRPIPSTMAREEAEFTAQGIADMVAGTERTSRNVLTGLMAICVGLPLLLGLVRAHPLLGVANALLLGLVGWGLARLVHTLILNPVSVVRYARAAARLGRNVQTEGDAVALHRSWSEGTPGAITVTSDGRVRLADRSTGYHPIALDRGDIRHAEVITNTLIHEPRRSGFAFGMGIPLGGGLMAHFARIPHNKAPQIRTSHMLVIRYAERGDAAIRTTSIPFGPDLADARFMAAILDWDCPSPAGHS